MVNQCYLDTNVILFLLGAPNKNILKRRILAIINDYTVSKYISSVVVSELFYHFKRGRIESLKGYRNFNELLKDIRTIVHEIKYFNESHMKLFYSIDLLDKDIDNIDLMIVTQSIQDKIPLITTDRHFESYIEKYKLKLITNY
jgi:PIN domain nuclease of toxin-antitoxin system